jgi:hypothetical protein
MKCVSCGLENPPSAKTCDCGYPLVGGIALPLPLAQRSDLRAIASLRWTIALLMVLSAVGAVAVWVMFVQGDGVSANRDSSAPRVSPAGEGSSKPGAAGRAETITLSDLTVCGSSVEALGQVAKLGSQDWMAASRLLDQTGSMMLLPGQRVQIVGEAMQVTKIRVVSTDLSDQPHGAERTAYSAKQVGQECWVLTARVPELAERRGP